MHLFKYIIVCSVSISMNLSANELYGDSEQPYIDQIYYDLGIEELPKTGYARFFSNFSRDNLQHIHDNFNNIIAFNYHGTNSAALIGIKQLKHMHPLKTLVEKFKFIPLSGEFFMEEGFVMVNETISMLDFVLFDRAVEYAKKISLWSPSESRQTKIGDQAEGQFSVSEFKFELELKRMNKYEQLPAQDRVLVDQPFPILIAAHSSKIDSMIGFGDSPELIVSNSIPISDMVLIVPQAKIDQVKKYLGKNSVKDIWPLELMLKFNKQWTLARKYWSSKNSELVQDLVFEAQAIDNSIFGSESIHWFHEEFLFAQYESESVHRTIQRKITNRFCAESVSK